MKYYLIAGEASGDLHASRLMQSLKKTDTEASFRFIGGDLMSAVGGTRVKHYRELAYMGFIPVLLHLPTILRNMRLCKLDIAEWQPDAVILVDYPGFNLSIAKDVRKRREERGKRKGESGKRKEEGGKRKEESGKWKEECLRPQIYYYISPKIWAWKEYRIKQIKRDIDELFSILPFEVPFFEEKHHYPIHYVGNPTADEVREFLANRQPSPDNRARKVIALLAGSRKQEIKDNLPPMLEAVKGYEKDFQIVLAGAPGIAASYYDRFLQGHPVQIVFGQTYDLLSRAHAALVTSGTATLETALFGVPQVVCYKLPLPKVSAFVRRHLLNVRYISLVNLIADREVVTELLADTFTVANIRAELSKILQEPCRQEMLRGYADVWQRLGDQKAPDNAARMIYTLLNNLSK